MPRYEQKWLTEDEIYALEMLTVKRNEIPYEISQYPLIYCFAGIFITCLLKKQICKWFEFILYTEEETDQERLDRLRALRIA